MTESGFEGWLRSLLRDSHLRGEQETIDDEWRPWLRDLYARLGPLAGSELEDLALEARIAIAEEVFPLVTGDIERTTDQSAAFQVFCPEYLGLEYGTLGLMITLSDGGASGSPVDWGPTRASALVAVADFAMESVMETIWTAWPVCPTDNYGLDPVLVDGRAVWRCRSARHEVVAPIGELGR